jgi:hypothetical protein
MELVMTPSYANPVIVDFIDQVEDIGLVYYASDVAAEMEFEDMMEFHEALRRAMEMCLYAGIPITGNFKRIYKSSGIGIISDWKLSVLAYRLVGLNGKPSNPKVARMQIELLNHKSNYYSHGTFDISQINVSA